MSFVTQEDVFAAIEPVLARRVRGIRRANGSSPPVPFPRIPYDEAMLKYGTDKPDLRNPARVIADVTEIFRARGFGIFAQTVAAGGVVRAIPAPGTGAAPAQLLRQAERLGARSRVLPAWATSSSPRAAARARSPRISMPSAQCAGLPRRRAQGRRCRVLRLRQEGDRGAISPAWRAPSSARSSA